MLSLAPSSFGCGLGEGSCFNFHFFSVSSGSVFALAMQPWQQRKTGWPRRVIFTGTPIEPSGVPVTGQMRCASASFRSASGSCSMFLRSSAGDRRLLPLAAGSASAGRSRL